MNKFRTATSRTILVGLALLVSLFAIGTAGFMIIDGYSAIDAFFMTIITVSTVGFTVVQPLSDGGKIFTSILIFSSISTVAYVVSRFTQFFFDGDFAKYIKTYRVDKRIARLTDHVIICGFGRNGEQAAIELSEHNKQFVIVEKRDNVIEHVRNHPDFLYVRGDATHEDVLLEAGIDRAKAVIATTPNDADNVFVVLTARSMNENLTIISRASDKNAAGKLRRAGADNVVLPERIGGQRMAKLIAQPDVLEFLDYVLLQSANEVTLEEVSCTNMSCKLSGKSLSELKIRNLSGANIVGLKKFGGEYVFNPDPGTILECEDKIFVLGSPDQILRLREAMVDS